MAKMLLVQVPAQDGIPAHTVQMTPDDAALFWEAQEGRYQEQQKRLAERKDSRPVIPTGSGVLFARPSTPFEAVVRGMGLEVASGDTDGIPFDRTIVWDPSASLRMDLVPIGLRLLDRWEMLAPLAGYTELARDIGTEGERELTATVIRDLRVPVYDTRVLFLRKCDETKAMWEAWREERQVGRDERLAFLRALWRVKPIYQALPAGVWVTS